MCCRRTCAPSGENGQYRATRDPEEVRASFETMLKNLGTDYIDVGMIHYVDSVSEWEKIANGPVMQYAKAQKEAGHIRFLGVSSHNPEAALAAVESGSIDVADVQRQPVLRPAARR